MSLLWGVWKELTLELCRAQYSLDSYFNAESMEGSHCVQRHSNVLWKFAAVLIDILRQETLPQCLCEVQLIRLYLVPCCTDYHARFSLWSTKEMKKRKETSLANQHTLAYKHTFVTFPSHYFLTLSVSLVHMCPHTHGKQAETHCCVRGHTHSLKLRHKALQCCSSDICIDTGMDWPWFLTCKIMQELSWINSNNLT